MTRAWTQTTQFKDKYTDHESPLCTVSPFPWQGGGGALARNFQRGVTLCLSEGTHQIVMSFSPGAVLRLFALKVRFTDTPGPPSYALGNTVWGKGEAWIKVTCMYTSVTVLCVQYLDISRAICIYIIYIFILGNYAFMHALIICQSADCYYL